MSEYIDWWIRDINLAFVGNGLQARLVDIRNVMCLPGEVQRVAEIVGKEVVIECK